MAERFLLYWMVSQSLAARSMYVLKKIIKYGKKQFPKIAKKPHFKNSLKRLC